MKVITEEEVLQKLKEEWDFNKLLEPYKEGGASKDHPVERTWGTVIDWLMNKHKFPPDIIGAAIFVVWMQIKVEGPFKPSMDDKGRPVWGSAGDKFVHAIRVTAAALMKEKMSQDIFSGMAGEVENRVRSSIESLFWNISPWFVKIFSVKFYKYKSRRRKLSKNG